MYEKLFIETQCHNIYNFHELMKCFIEYSPIFTRLGLNDVNYNLDDIYVKNLARQTRAYDDISITPIPISENYNGEVIETTNPGLENSSDYLFTVTIMEALYDNMFGRNTDFGFTDSWKEAMRCASMYTNPIIVIYSKRTLHNMVGKVENVYSKMMVPFYNNIESPWRKTCDYVTAYNGANAYRIVSNRLLNLFYNSDPWRRPIRYIRRLYAPNHGRLTYG